MSRQRIRAVEAPVVKTDQMRRFEAAMAAYDPDPDLRVQETGVYVNVRTHLIWVGWQLAEKEFQPLGYLDISGASVRPVYKPEGRVHLQQNQPFFARKP